MSSLPSELIRTIVNELSDDRKSLKSCAQVASTFCAPCQQHLFRKIWLHAHYSAAQREEHLDSTTAAGTIKRAHEILVLEAPHLIKYVRDLTFDIPESAEEDAPLAEILRSMSVSLRRLVISGLGVGWDGFSESLSSSLLLVLGQSPALRSMHLLDMHGVPIQTIYAAMVRLTAFSAHRCTFRGKEDEDRQQPVMDAPLEHLILSKDPGPTWTLFFCPGSPRLTQLKALYLRMTPDAERFIASVSSTLTSLELDCGDLSFPIILPDLPKLTELKLRILSGFVRHIPYTLLPTIALIPRTVSLTTVFSVTTRMLEIGWTSDGRAADTHVNIQSMTCILHFRGQNGSERTGWDGQRSETFRDFQQVLTDTLPEGMDLDFERMDGEGDYIDRLP